MPAYRHSAQADFGDCLIVLPSFFFPAFLLMQKWGEIIGQARQSVDFLKDQDVIRTVLNILQVLLSNRLSNFCWIYWNAT